MKTIKRILCVMLSAFLICAGAALFAQNASADGYADGTYSASVRMQGEGWHNSIVSPTTVYIENGEIYADIVFVRTSAPLHAPAYASVTTSYGTFKNPVVDETNYTCAFYRVHIDNLGEFTFSAVTEAMSQPYSVEYTIYIDPSGIPEKAEEPAATQDPEPTVTTEPVPATEPVTTTEPTPPTDPVTTTEPTPATEPVTTT